MAKESRTDDILRLAEDGLSSKEIARQLGCTRIHVNRVIADHRNAERIVTGLHPAVALFAKVRK